MSTRTPLLGLDNKHYDPTRVEKPTYELWESRGVFRADNQSKKPPYTIVIPPPNVTGRLHMGHALNNTIQDVLIRYKRMDGFDALWVPGTDHAGIATQTVVKKHLDAEGIDFKDLGREKMIERIWTWKHQYGDAILNQLRRLGCSCDWSRTRFTMDDGLSGAVRQAFKNLYDRDLIYRGKYIVNWCPVDRTALSDDEVETKDGGEPGFLWEFHYPLVDGEGHVTIATTRPETMLGDTAVAVNPRDDRYSHLIGKKVRVPLVDREVPIIADDFVDTKFGTGCLKVTPAHDPNDFQIGLRHELPQITVMEEDATMNDEVPEAFRGLDRFECRKKVVAAMKELGHLGRVEERMTPVGRSYRSKAIIEYRLSDQWFVKMRPLADRALEASDDGKITFYPERWDSFYRQWLTNTRDWCISRQIWWGHRIPAWHHRETGEILVDVDTPAQVAQNPDQWRQDDDVLDTWFSSALWPYSTLGWPESTDDVARYYPTSVLVTAKDIIYFWVARMVMTGIEFRDDVPFRQVYITSTICDEDGETMSKSKGNGIDPLHIIEGATREELEGPAREARYHTMEHTLERIAKNFPNGFEGVGADALRFTMLTLTSDAQQASLSLGRFDEIGRRFSNKLWNAARFALQNFEDIPPSSVEPAKLALEDQWILGRYDRCIAKVRGAYDSFALHEATDSLYHFFWDDVCDWYLELIKPRLKEGSEAERRRVQLTLGEVFSGFLAALHPIAPFITEEIWGHLHPRLVEGDLFVEGNAESKSSDLVALAPFPRDGGRFDESFDGRFTQLQDVAKAIRNIRAHAGLPERTALGAQVRPLDADTGAFLKRGQEILTRSAHLSSLDFPDQKPDGMSSTVVTGCEVYVNLAEHLDVSAELDRAGKELKKIEQYIAKLSGKLGNENFVKKAPAAIIDAERERLREAEDKRDRIQASIRELESQAR